MFDKFKTNQVINIFGGHGKTMSYINSQNSRIIDQISSGKLNSLQLEQLKVGVNALSKLKSEIESIDQTKVLAPPPVHNL